MKKSVTKAPDIDKELEEEFLSTTLFCSYRQAILIKLLVNGMPLKEALDEAKVSRAAYYRWLHRPEFTAPLSHYRRLLARQALESVTQHAERAVNNIAAKIDDSNPNVSLRASAMVLQYAEEAIYNGQLIDRLRAVEDMVQSQERKKRNEE